MVKSHLKLREPVVWEDGEGQAQTQIKLGCYTARSTLPQNSSGGKWLRTLTFPFSSSKIFGRLFF